MNLFWVDNDYIAVLNPFSKRLERKGFTLKKFGTFEDATAFISDPEFEEIKSVLLDVIIPANTRCMSYAGFEVAKEILRKAGVKRIAFLSVVHRNEVNDSYSELRNTCGSEIELKYVNKAQLLDPNVFDDLVRFLMDTKG